MMKTIWFDCDGTIADLYAFEGWLEDLRNFNPRPYIKAQPMINLSLFARKLNELQRKGYKIGIISWLSKVSNEEYDELVTEAKLKWLSRHMPSVKWDAIHILPYGTPKENYGDGILFDDELRNRQNWNGVAFDEKNIMQILKAL